MKKIFALVMSLVLVLCSANTAFALKDNTVKSGRTGGVLIQQGTSLKSNLPKTIESDSALPEYYSSVDEDYVTSVKDQDEQNTCVLFSSTAAMETALLINGYGEYDLSEEYGNYWASIRKDGTGWQRDRVNIGAFPNTGYGYLTSGGVVEESLFPYMSRTEEYFENLGDIEPLFYAGGIKVICEDDITVENMKESIMHYGGVVSSFVLSSKYMEKNNNAFFCGDALGDDELSSLGHSVYVVGWDDNYPKEKFLEGAQPNNNGAWLIKNSWGTFYDYIWISYEDKYLGADLFGGNYAVTDVIKNHSCNELLNIDTYGTIYNMNFEGAVIDPYDVTFINTFDFSKEMPSISNVQFTTESVDADYDIYYIPTDNGVPTDYETRWVKLAQGQIPYNGTHNISFDPYIVPDSQGAIGVRIISNDAIPASIGCCEWLGDSGNYQFLPRTQDNRSFIKSGNESLGLTEYYNYLDDDLGGNFSIRVLANVQQGDADKNGEINVNDVTNVQKYCAKKISLTEENIDVADVNNDGVVNVRDATLVQMYIAKMIESFS